MNEENKIEFQNEYSLFYEMMVQALQTDDVKNGINNSLLLLKNYLACGDIVIHKKMNDGSYAFFVSHSGMDNMVNPITCVVDKTARLIEKKGIFKIDLNISENFQNFLFMSIKTKDYNYILSINNFDDKKKLDDNFFNKMQETLQIIFKRAELYERNMMAINLDLLTGLNNRNYYEKRTIAIDNEDNDYVYGIFDLFRLKYINDNYGHAVGDTYIKETAKILDKYWPKCSKSINEKGELIEMSLHELYRIGGDEFVLITNKEPIEVTRIKALLAAEEVSICNLDIPKDIQLGLNYGIAIHSHERSIKDTYLEADAIMQADKREWYKKYNLDRRK